MHHASSGAPLRYTPAPERRQQPPPSDVSLHFPDLMMGPGAPAAVSSLAPHAVFREIDSKRDSQLAGHECINGGGKTGCMGAVTEACKEHGGRVVSASPQLSLPP